MGSTGASLSTYTGTGHTRARGEGPLLPWRLSESASLSVSTSSLQNGLGIESYFHLPILPLALPGPPPSPLALGSQDHWEEVRQARPRREQAWSPFRFRSRPWACPAM